VGDYNGDGKTDLAVANANSSDGGDPAEVLILLGAGNGTFSEGGHYTAGKDARSIASEDFNGDGKEDLAVVNEGSNDISVLLGVGDGTFLPAVNYKTGKAPQSVTAADFNDDGHMDLVVANEDSDDISILLGRGDGTFAESVSHRGGSDPQAVIAGDFNGDGKEDLAIVNEKSGNVFILINDTAGITVSPTSGLVTGEDGTTATFSVVLTARPSSKVTIDISSSDETEGSVAPSSLTFTPENWNIAQPVIITGIDDTIVDGDIAYTINTVPAVSSDPRYQGLDPDDVSVVNKDNDEGIAHQEGEGDEDHKSSGSCFINTLLHSWK
jgi:hypothetical protein